MWDEVRKKVDDACLILECVLEECGEPYPADVYLIWNDLAFTRYQLEVKSEGWD